MKSLIVYGSSDDGFIQGSSTDPSTARSTSAAHIDTGEYIYVGHAIISAGGPSNYLVNRGFLKFDTSVIPANSIITAARLRLVASEWATTTPLTVHVVEQDWGALDLSQAIDRETAYDDCLAGVDFVNFHTFEGSQVYRPPGGWIRYSDPLNIEWIDPEGYTYYSLRTHLDYAGDPATHDMVTILSAESSLQTFHPALIIDYIELPADPVTDRLYYYLYVDWEGTGTVDSWQDEAGRVTKFVLDRGKERTIGSPGSGFQPPNIGRAILTLDNFDGRYDPWNKHTPLYHKEQMEVSGSGGGADGIYDFVDITNGKPNYYRSDPASGWLYWDVGGAQPFWFLIGSSGSYRSYDDVYTPDLAQTWETFGAPLPPVPTVVFTGEGHGLIKPGRRVNFAVYYNGTYYNLMTGYLADLRPVGYRQETTMIIEDGAGWLAARPPDIPLRAVSDAGDAISAVLDDMGYPFERDIDPGVDALAYYWTSGASGLTEIHKLANSDLGRFCVSADGTARFRNRHNSEEVRHTLTEDQIGKDIFIPMPWDYTRSVVDVYTYPRILGAADCTLWTLRDPPTISDGDTLTLWGEYTYDDQRVPATGVYIHSYQPSADLDVTLTAFSRDAKLDIVNESGSSQILTELIIKGQPIYSPDKIRIREQDDPITGLPAVFVMDYEWLTNINTAVSFAQVLLAFLSDAKQYPEILIYNRPAVACAIDLEERLRLLLDTFEIDMTFFVHKISHRSGSSPQELITHIKLYPMLQDIGEDTFVLDSATQGVLDENKLGY